MKITDEIEQFILQKANNGALLLTGKWGCGKSFTIHQIAEEKNKGKDCLLVITSLFGIDSINNLHRAVNETVAFSKGFSNQAETIKKRFSGIKNKVSPFASVLSESSKIAKGVNAVLNISWSDFVTIDKIISCFVDGEQCEKRLVLIFDDFERSKIDIVDLMGAINYYSEGKGIKVIIVADEDKISPSNYNDIKEKLISRTVHMSMDSSYIVKSIVDSYNETVVGYKDFLNKNISIIHQVFIDSQSENIRSLKSILVDFERVFKTWKNTGIPMEGYVETILYQFSAAEFEYKAGNYIDTSISFIIHVDGDNEKSDKKSSIEKKYASDTFSGFITSLSNWIVNGEWNEAFFADELKKRYLPDELSPEQRFIFWRFWDLQQNDIDEGLPIVLERAYNGEASRDELISLLQKVHAMREYEIPLPCSIEYSKIKSGFEERKEKIKNGLVDEPERHIFSEKNQLDIDAVDLYNKIEALDCQLYAWENRRLFISYLKNENKVSYYDLKGKWLDSFDDELVALFLDRYKNAPNSQKRNLCWVLNDFCFDDQNYSTKDDMKCTVTNFKKLIEKIELTIEPAADKMANAITKSFVKLLKEKIIIVSESLS